jgi:hypothetical protein
MIKSILLVAKLLANGKNTSIMLLEEGKKYTTREGAVTGPLVINEDGTNYIFESKVQKPQHPTSYHCSWLKDGRYLSPLINHPLDLIK